MPKKATKAASNVFYQARIKASSYNDKLASREGASEITGIDRNRIVYTELGTLCPYPEEVLIYADAYNAPELLNHFSQPFVLSEKKQLIALRLVALNRQV